MNLSKKKELAARTLDVGKARITFVKSRMDEIKEAITKQDIRDLKNDGAIIVKEIKGKKKVVKRKRRGPGKVKKKVNKRKQEYVKRVRKQRKYLKEMQKQGNISREDVKDLRKKVRNKIFRSLAHLKIGLGGKK